mgnify:CR=1 FL=1
MPLWMHWALAIFTSIMAIGFISIVTISIFAQWETGHWHTTTGTVEDYDFFCNYDDEGGCNTQEDIVYTYTVDGINYTNDVVNLGWAPIEYQWYLSLGLTNGVILENGDEIQVFYAPYDPQRSVLIPGEDGVDYFDYFSIVGSIIITSIFLITARKKGSISDALNQFKGLAQSTTQIQRQISDSSNKPRNYQNFRTTHHESISYTQYGISPSRMRGYESAIAYLSLDNSMNENTVKSLVQSKFGISSQDAQKFVDSNYVKSVLFHEHDENEQTNLLDGKNGSSQELQSQLISNFQAAIQEAMEEESDSSVSTTNIDNNIETCNHDKCNNQVAFYSFQCFSCRKKFCDEHKGKSIQCNDCSD